MELSLETMGVMGKMKATKQSAKADTRRSHERTGKAESSQVCKRVASGVLGLNALVVEHHIEQ
jgi:hypothetical protein